MLPSWSHAARAGRNTQPCPGPYGIFAADSGEEPARPGGEVSGKGIYRDLDDDKPGQDVARCEEAFSIKGTKRALTKADLEMNKAAVKRDFEFFAKKGCTLPMLGEGVHGANVEVTIPAQ